MKCESLKATIRLITRSAEDFSEICNGGTCFHEPQLTSPTTTRSAPGWNPACLAALLRAAYTPNELRTCKLQVAGVLQKLLLHAAERLHDHLLHLFLFAVSDGHEGGEEFPLFLSGVLQPAWRDLKVSLHVKGLQRREGEGTRLWVNFHGYNGSRLRWSRSRHGINFHIGK